MSLCLFSVAHDNYYLAAKLKFSRFPIIRLKLMLKKEMNLACINRKQALCLFSWFFGINHHLKPLFVDTLLISTALNIKSFKFHFKSEPKIKRIWTCNCFTSKLLKMDLKARSFCRFYMVSHFNLNYLSNWPLILTIYRKEK